MAPTRDFIEKLFNINASEGFNSDFLDHLAEDLTWTITGPSPVKGTYHGKNTYKERIRDRLYRTLETYPQPIVDRIVVEGEWASVMFHTNSVLGRNGHDFSMEYLWLMRVHQGKVVEVIAFLDSIKLTRVLEDAE